MPVDHPVVVSPPVPQFAKTFRRGCAAGHPHPQGSGGPGEAPRNRGPPDLGSTVVRPLDCGEFMPRAFITGITGQDGQHLAEFLHGKGYEVYGMVKGQNNPKADPDRRGDAVRRAGAG